MKRLVQFHARATPAPRIPGFLALEVEGPGGLRYPAHLKSKTVVCACGAVSKNIPVFVVARFPLDSIEEAVADELVADLRAMGYHRAARD